MIIVRTHKDKTTEKGKKRMYDFSELPFLTLQITKKAKA